VTDLISLVFHRPVKIVVVEDSAVFAEQMRSCLGNEYDLSIFGSVEAFQKVLEPDCVDLLLLDVMLPGMTGLDFLPIFRKMPEFKNIPVIIMSSLEDIASKRSAFTEGANDYIIKPCNEDELRMRVHTHLQVYASMQFIADQKNILEKQVQKQTEEILRNQDATIAALASLAETRDNETGKHIQRTMKYMELLLKIMAESPDFKGELTQFDAKLLAKSAPLHDIGKVGIPDAILLKPGPLTAQERKIMENHTILGYEAIRKAENMVGSSSYLSYAKNICLCHHEHWNGKGYPRHLSGLEIPLEGRIMALCDVYDALISERNYKAPFSHNRACSMLREARAQQFDPRILDLFMEHHLEFKAIAKANMDTVEEFLTLDLV